MAGYQCMLHDGEADATNIHQTLGKPGVIAVCDKCQPMYFITALADVLGVDAGGLYEVVRAHQVAVQQLGKPPAPPDVADQPEVPAGPHPAGPASGNLADGWDWCSCDAPGPHHADGSPIDFEAIGQLREEECYLCQVKIRGTLVSIQRLLDTHRESGQHQDMERQEALES